MTSSLAYLTYVGTEATIYLMVALSYALPLGYGGLVNFGHIGLFAVGAYAGGILTTRGAPFWLALAAAGLVTGLVGWLLALPARRIRGDYYALMTLGFTFVVNAAILNLTPLTRGPFGLTGVTPPPELADPRRFFVLCLVLLGLTAVVVWRLAHGPLGKALEAVRDDELLAESLGKPVAKLKVVALTVSAVLVGVAGALMAHFLQFINANVFWLDKVVWIIAAVVIGGLASLRGAVAGMLLLYLIHEPIRFLPIPSSYVGPLRLIIFSLLLLLVVLFRPKGLYGRAQLEA